MLKKIRQYLAVKRTQRRLKKLRKDGTLERLQKSLMDALDNLPNLYKGGGDDEK